MKHIIKFSLTLLSVSVLAACGGGGSGGGSNSSGNVTNPPINNAQTEYEKIAEKVNQHLNAAEKIGATVTEKLKQAEAAKGHVTAAREVVNKESTTAKYQSSVAVHTFSAGPMKDRMTVEKAELAKNNAITAFEKVKRSVDVIDKQATLAQEAARLAEERANHVGQAQIELEKANFAAEDALRKASRLVNAAENAVAEAVAEENRLLEQIKESEDKVQLLSSQGLNPAQQLLLQARYKASYQNAKDQTAQLRKQAQQAKREAENLHYQAEDLRIKTEQARIIAEKMNHDSTSANAFQQETEVLQRSAHDSLNKAKLEMDKMKSINFVKEEEKETVKQAKELQIDNHPQKIYLADEYYGYVTKKIEDKQLKVYNLGYSGFGYVLSPDVKTDEYGQLVNNVTAQYNIGDNTKSLPTKQVFTYHGQSFGAKTDGVLTLKADFENKTVEGTVTDRRVIETKKSLSDITLQQTAIKSGDYHFEGTASYQTNEAVKGKYNGNFKGPKAQEVVGYIFDGKDHFYEGFAGKAEVNESILGNKKP